MRGRLLVYRNTGVCAYKRNLCFAHPAAQKGSKGQRLNVLELGSDACSRTGDLDPFTKCSSDSRSFCDCRAFKAAPGAAGRASTQTRQSPVKTWEFCRPDALRGCWSQGSRSAACLQPRGLTAQARRPTFPLHPFAGWGDGPRGAQGGPQGCPGGPRGPWGTCLQTEDVPQSLGDVYQSLGDVLQSLGHVPPDLEDD